MCKPRARQVIPAPEAGAEPLSQPVATQPEGPGASGGRGVRAEIKPSVKN